MWRSTRSTNCRGRAISSPRQAWCRNSSGRHPVQAWSSRSSRPWSSSSWPQSRSSRPWSSRSRRHYFRSCPELCNGLRDPAFGTVDHHLVQVPGAGGTAHAAGAVPCCASLRGPRMGSPPEGGHAAPCGEHGCISTLVTLWAALHGIDHADFTVVSALAWKMFPF